MNDWKPERKYAADDKTLGFSLQELSQILADATALTFSRERTHLQLGQSNSGKGARQPIAFLILVEEPVPADGSS